MDVFLARQPIFSRDRRVYGYELLFRSGSENRFDGTEATAATTQLLSNSLMAHGLENIVGHTQAFVNFGREPLLRDWHTTLPKESTVIEILETVEPDEEVIQACRRIRDAGYRLALDDFVLRPGYEALLEFASIVKIEMPTIPTDENAAMVSSFHKKGLKVLAEKVETYQEFRTAFRAGYDYYQGYFFARPVVLRAQQIPAAAHSCIQLLQEAREPELDMKKLEQLIVQNVSFSYKLLRYANCALFSRRTEIRSIREALLFLGENHIRRWIALAALPALAKDKPEELIVHSLVRAVHCQSVAHDARASLEPQAFLMGLFSLLDAVMDRPLEQLLAEIKLPSDVTAALTGQALRGDSLASVYNLIRAYEAADWGSVESLAPAMGLAPERVAGAYAEAVRWAREALRGISSEPASRGAVPLDQPEPELHPTR